jgi:cytosine/adenosine deaminase-related metal-dependent hydrolase
VRRRDVGEGELPVEGRAQAATHRYRADELVEHCVAVATTGGAAILDPAAPRLCSTADRPGLAVGDPAELLLVDGETVTSAVMDRGSDRTVLHAGRVVVGDGVPRGFGDCSAIDGEASQLNTTAGHSEPRRLGANIARSDRALD